MKANEKEKRRQDDADFQGWLSTPAGRRVYVRTLTQAGLWSSSYAEKATATAYNEGRRSIALNLLQEAQRVCPELHALALREQLDKVLIDKQTAKKQADENRAADE